MLQSPCCWTVGYSSCEGLIHADGRTWVPRTTHQREKQSGRFTCALVRAVWRELLEDN